VTRFRAALAGLGGAHRRALAVIAASLALLLADSALFARAEHLPYALGVYNILADAETFGGTTGPSTPLGYWSAVVVCVLLIPLLGAAISLFTSGLTETHLKRVHARLDALHETAASAHRIAADLHERLAGVPHPDAPAQDVTR